MKSKSLYLLDTDICIYTIKKRPPAVVKKVQEIPGDTICISSVTISELEYGIQKSQIKNASRDCLIRFLVPFKVIDFTPSDAFEYGKIRTFLESQGKIIGPYDLQIAAQALSRNLILVTNNTREYSRIPNLRIENWATEI
ncbi:MAG: type II toxin-antitoxin system VapC family toxin [Candidatus Riflebacteria bacterium]|nr:type II toxin-antitoxin system VapC family toxin [Candidatus Riflebacteria bacterium]